MTTDVQQDELEALIISMVRALCDVPKAVHVRIVFGSMLTIYEVVCAKEDIPKVIGRGGAHMKSMRVLLEAAATRLGRRVQLELDAPIIRRS